jgi:hypothetical protein
VMRHERQEGGRLRLHTSGMQGMTMSRRTRKLTSDCTRGIKLLTQLQRGVENRPDQLLVLIVERIGAGRTYRATIDGRLIIPASAQPFLDAAHVLLAEGYDPNRKLEMWRPEKASWDLRGPLLAAAKLDVERGRFVWHREIRPENLARASKTKSGTPPADTPAERTSEPLRRRRAAGGGR